MAFGKKHTIARKVLFAVILMSTAMTILTSSYQLYGNYNRYVAQINIRFNEIEKIHVKNLSNRLWTADIEALQLNLEEVSLLPDISYIAVEENGTLVAQFGTQQIKNRINRSFDMTYLYKGKLQTIGKLIVQATLENAYQQVVDQIFDILISNGIKTFFLAGFILFIFNFFITRHLETMATFAVKLNIDTLNNKLELERKKNKPSEPDELDLLVTAFTNMQRNLKTSYSALKDNHAHINLLLNSAAEAIYGTDTNGLCTFVNRACLDMLKYGHENELIGKNMHLLTHHSFSDGSNYPIEQCHIFEAFKNRIRSHIDTEVFWRSDGSQFPVEYWSHPIVKNDQCTGAVVTFIDITLRKENEAQLSAHKNNLEKLISERTDELLASNKELEAFSYSVSHDLRAPLRGIDGFSEILLEDYTDQIDSTGKNYLNRIRKASQKMGQIISDLLLLSRVTRQELVIKEIDLNPIVKDIIAVLQADNQNSVEINIQDNLVTEADANLLPIVLSNLIENAWKYSSLNDNAVIEIGETEKNNKKYFYVRDNGIGFSMEYIEKIFEPFQRLHSANKFEGTGIGLATVARVIQKHRGEIFAESEPDKGATFYFSFTNKK